jgi:hypothetical protein
MCGSNPSGVLVFAINKDSQFYPVCYTSGISNTDPVFNNSNLMIRAFSKPGMQVNFYSDVDGKGSIVASLPMQNSQIPTIGEFPNIKFKSIKVTPANTTVPGQSDPTCPVGSYSKVTGGICTGNNTAKDSEGDLPDSYSGLPDVTCPKGSGTSKKTGGICAGPIPNDGAVAWTGRDFGNAGGTQPPVPDASGTIVDISGVDLSGNAYSYPNIPLADLLSMFNFSTSTTTTTTPTPVATASAATTAAPPISLDTLKSLIRKEVAKEMEEDEMCECEESPSIQQGCDVQKKKVDLSMNKQKDSIPCWGC